MAVSHGLQIDEMKAIISADIIDDDAAALR